MGACCARTSIPAWTRHSGYAREQVIGRTLDVVFPADQAAFFEAQFRQAIETGQPVEYEYTTQFPAGEAVRRAFQVPLRGPGWHGGISCC